MVDISLETLEPSELQTPVAVAVVAGQVANLDLLAAQVL
jgi:hypothetical protein